jgi:predicted metalloprotease
MPDESAPKPGHFLPGGEGDAPAETGGRTVPGDSVLSKAEPLAAPTPRLGATAPPGPPPLSGSRLGPPPPGDLASAAFRARYSPEPIPFVPPKRSKLLIAGIVVVALVVVGGGVTVAAKVLSSYDDLVANPLSAPSLHTPTPPGDQSTAYAPTATPTPDLVVQQKNKLYGTGKLTPSKCKEPAYRPTSKENVKAYYQASLVCLNKSWEPSVRKAGYEFHAPKLVIFGEGDETACGPTDGVAQYCDADDGSVQMPWQDVVNGYRVNQAQARVNMAAGLAYVYGHHVQNLTGIFQAWTNRRDEAPNEAARLLENRRSALQAACFSSMYLGADKASFPLQGQLLEAWRYASRHSGDENSKDKVRDHGSRKNVELWMQRGFTGVDPASCNTFAATADKVS